jgi:hypothetical protein
MAAPLGPDQSLADVLIRRSVRPRATRAAPARARRLSDVTSEEGLDNRLGAISRSQPATGLANVLINRPRREIQFSGDTRRGQAGPDQGEAPLLSRAQR